MSYYITSYNREGTVTKADNETVPEHNLILLADIGIILDYQVKITITDTEMSNYVPLQGLHSQCC